MKITGFKLYTRDIKLDRPFTTALETVSEASELIFELNTDIATGYGASVPTEVITGDSMGGMVDLLKNKIGPALIDLNPLEINKALKSIDGAVIHNYAAKAAAEIALYDLVSSIKKEPLWKYLGGSKRDLYTDMTIGVNDSHIMAESAVKATSNGFKTLKLKVGIDPELDFNRVKAVYQAVGPDISLRLDANQGWTVNQAINIIKRFENAGLKLELVEQPVSADDIEGLKLVKDNVLTPIMADESLFTVKDAVKLLELRAIDYLNIKLMKTGGIRNALQIADLADRYGINCLLGCMLETRVSITAAASVASAAENITKLDLDAPLMIGDDGVDGGVTYADDKILLNNQSGLGINEIKNLKSI